MIRARGHFMMAILNPIASFSGSCKFLQDPVQDFYQGWSGNLSEIYHDTYFGLEKDFNYCIPPPKIPRKIVVRVSLTFQNYKIN